MRIKKNLYVQYPYVTQRRVLESALSVGQFLTLCSREVLRNMTLKT